MRKPSNFAELVCARPRMFTATGTLPEVIAFLSGMDYAAQVSTREGAEVDSGSPRFVLDWLTNEFSLPGTAANSNWIPGLLDRYGNEEAAIAAIQKYAASLPKDVDRRFEIHYDD